MNRLVPEKRQDRNGRMVTRHVRQDSPAPRGTRALPPAPAPGQPDPPPAASLADTPGLRRSQREQKQIHLAYVARSRDLLAVLPSWGRNDLTFESSEVEVYDVAAACASESDAAHLVSAGIRSGEAAREFLRSEGLGHLIADRTELMREALSKGLKFEDFFNHIDSGRPERPAGNRIGAARLRASSLSGTPGIPRVMDSVLGGRIDFDDIKAVGIGLLKRDNKLVNFTPLLERAHEGRDGYSVESIRAFAERIEAEQVNMVHVIAQFAELAGVDALLELPSLRAATYAHQRLSGCGVLNEPGAAARVLYAARFTSESRDPKDALEFYDAGIPVELAVAVRENGGGVTQAQAIQQEGVPAAVAGGWL